MDWVKWLFTERKPVYDHVSEKLKMMSTMNFFCQGDVLYKTARPSHISKF